MLLEINILPGVVSKKKAAVIATGWVGDTIACTAAATSLHELGYEVTFFTRWPQLKPILKNDKRFKVRTYFHLRLIKLFKKILARYFDKVVWEPSRWSYQEPFTSEIRRIAGCNPNPEYQLFLTEDGDGVNKGFLKNANPVIAIGRDIYKRAFGRNVDELVSQLEEFATVIWVGLPPEMNSKHGKGYSLLNDAKLIAGADIFVGPEGGLLWLAAGLGKPCAYLTENISAVAKQNHIPSLDHVLGSKNYFPDSENHLALPEYCSNQQASKLIKSMLHLPS